MSATGHAKNVANFETVTITLSALGAVYNPSQTLIALAALDTKLAEGKAVLGAVDTREAEKKNAVNERAEEFENLGRLASDVKRAAEVDVNDAAFTANLATVTRKFYGGRASGKPADNPATLDVDESKSTRSVSERTYDNQVAFFADLIALLKTQPAYKPNETEVKIPTLEAKLAALEAKNNTAKAAIAALGGALDARDTALYDPETGIVKLVQLVKKYLERILGKDSAAYQQINALEFRRVKS